MGLLVLGTVALDNVRTPSGVKKRAAVPVPSVLPLAPATPANVLTTPVALIMRIVLLPLSAT